jgi:hypothetical protein
VKQYLVHVDGYEQSKYITCHEIQIDKNDNTILWADHVKIEFGYRILDVVGVE